RGPILPTAHDVAREFRFLSALSGTQARVPLPVVLCEDSEVIGAPFYLMERKHGVVIRAEVPAALDAPEQRRRIGHELVDALVEMHSVDWQATGLRGKAEGFLDRQLKRWQSQASLTVGKVRELPGLDAVTGWLIEHKPASSDSTVVHGDYKLDNVMFASEAPAHLLAIFDWEMATIGDPLADLGWLTTMWIQADDPPMTFELSKVTREPGFPTREELIARYEERSGRSMTDIRWYQTLAVWKSVVFMEG